MSKSHQRKTMTRERIAELRSKQHDCDWAPPWILRELLNEIERLQAENSQMRIAINTALKLYSPTAFPSSYKMLQDAVKVVTECPTKPPTQTGS